MRENRDRWRQCPGPTGGFFLAEEAPLRRLNTERVEQMRVDRYRPHAQGSIACREVDFAACVPLAAGCVRSDRRERLIDLPELQVLRRRDRASGKRERWKFRGQIQQLLGFGIPEWSQQHPIDDREDSGVGADPQRQRQQGDRREHGRAPERAQPMSHIAREVVEPRQASLVAKRIHRLRGTSGLEPCGACGIGGVETTVSGVFCGQFQVQPELLFQIAVGPARKQRSPETVNPFAKGAHFDLPASRFAVEQRVDDARHPVPRVSLSGELTPARRHDRVEAGFAIGLRGAPIPTD